MQIMGKTKEWKVVFCNHFGSRLKGNMGKERIDTILLFPHCNSIHTFFMRVKIDVLMLSKENKVLYVFEGISPFHILWPKKEVDKVLELPEGENIYQVGDTILIQKED
jgi:hypothetical protein